MEETKYVTWDVHNAHVTQMETEFARRDDENKRQNHRLDNLEDSVKQIQDLTISVNGMASSIDRMVKQLEKQGERLDKIEKEPADKWKQASWIVVSVILTAVVTFALTRVGL